MLTGKQKRFLKAKAHHIDPIFQVGKVGVNENMVKAVCQALEARELIKVSVLQNCDFSKEEIANQLVAQTEAELVQVIGRIIILYRESQENQHIVLPE